jgi:hypothetical protein
MAHLNGKKSMALSSIGAVSIFPTSWTYTARFSVAVTTLLRLVTLVSTVSYKTVHMF